MSTKLTIVLGAAALAALAACNTLQGAGRDLQAAGNALENKATNPQTAMLPAGTAGTVMYTSAGMPLYTYDRDTGTISACVDACAVTWPPLLAAANDAPGGDWTIITRPGGDRQWVYKGKPVYTYARDTLRGNPTGDAAAAGTWHVIR